MDADLIALDALPEWLPGDLFLRDSGSAWDGVAVRGYRYGDRDVELPPLQDYAVVAYCAGTTRMRRRMDGAWSSEAVGPGSVSLLTRAEPSHWVWPDRIEVVHVYLSQGQLNSTCRSMYERDIAEIELRDELDAHDVDLHRTALALAREAGGGGAGSRLLVDSLTCQLAVQILRGHANLTFRRDDAADGLSFRQQRAVRDYVEHHLQDSISLDDLAAQVSLSRYHFARRFRVAMGTSPHDWVLEQRVARAASLLSRTSTSLAEVALVCGFSDQSHLTREFRKRVGTTPARYRAGR